jgi:ribosomal protein L19E
MKLKCKNRRIATLTSLRRIVAGVAAAGTSHIWVQEADSEVVSRVTTVM